MMNRVNYKRTQSGGFLLEALIGVLIFSFGILGIVGLQAQSLRHTGDAEYRAEATYFANSLISQMWTDDPAVL
jgi:type IV pilus assembly protein PilV